MKIFRSIGRFFKRIGSAVKSKVTKRKVIQAVYFPVTVVAASATLWWFLPTWMAACVMAVVLIHEFGHYITASRLGRVADLPFFVAVPPFGVLGGTHVKGRDPLTDTQISTAGPKAGTAVAALALIGFRIMKFMPGVWAMFYLLLFQIYTGTLGGDGRKYRRAKRELEALDRLNVALVV